MSLSDETRTELRAALERPWDLDMWREKVTRTTLAALLDGIDQLRAEAETARTAYRLTIMAMEGEIAENDGVIRTLRHQRDDAEAAVDRVRVLADEWANQRTDYDEDTEQQIEDGRSILAALDREA